MISWCFIKKLRPTRAQLRASFIAGFFFFVGGHGAATVWCTGPNNGCHQALQRFSLPLNPFGFFCLPTSPIVNGA